MNWEIPTPDPHLVQLLSNSLSISPFLAGLLVGRGVATPEEAERFLAPRLADFVDPRELPQVDIAASRIVAAMEAGERIAIYGDYDADGVTSVALVLSFLRSFGVTAIPTLPHRIDDGYGLGLEQAQRIAASGATLLITVDCGSASTEAITWLNGQKVDVVVTDHHRLDHGIPPALAFVNPMAWELFPETQVLAGVGVVFLVLMACHLRLRASQCFQSKVPELKQFLDLVAVGTIADVVPMVGLNRALVATGLDRMRGGQCRPGILALREVAGQGRGGLDESTVSFHMAPRINAAGRLGRADLALRLLMETDIATAHQLANALNQRNEERKALEKAIHDEAEGQLHSMSQPGERFPAVLASSRWHQGVVGIVAARIVEKHHRPAILLTVREGVATGSARSVPGYNIGEALHDCRDILIRQGGHAMAAGLTIQEARIPELRQRLAESYERFGVDLPDQPSLRVDAVIPLAQVDAALLADIRRLAPCGQGNPQPVLGCRGVTVAEASVSRDGAHLRLKIEQDGRQLPAMFFRYGGSRPAPGEQLDIAYQPEIHTYGGVTELRLNVKDLVRYNEPRV